MAFIHVEVNTLHSSPDMEKAGEDISEGMLVHRKTDGTCVQVDASDSTHRVDGIALNLEAGDQIASHEYDYNSGIDDFVYQPSGNKDADDFFSGEDDRVPIGAKDPGSIMLPYTIKDNGTDPAPSIGRNDLVGVAPVGANEQDEIQGRVVQEGYTDDAGTTYGINDTGNFLPIGYVDYVNDANNSAMFDRKVAVRRAPFDPSSHP